jgi:hypothetical protein
MANPARHARIDAIGFGAEGGARTRTGSCLPEDVKLYSLLSANV